MEIKPGTLEDYRISIRLYIKPHIGKMRLQAVRPSTVTNSTGISSLAVGGTASRWRCRASSTRTRSSAAPSVTPCWSTST
ncbi:hypothetical protein [Planotetraspora sp. A-T 1434]|uniref:hypothetical protein n=1 Tax=Planotetraspora sp. A-T 1434 TaxID=2979219 RepID=UPI003965ACBC